MLLLLLLLNCVRLKINSPSSISGGERNESRERIVCDNNLYRSEYYQVHENKYPKSKYRLIRPNRLCRHNNIRM